MKFPRLKLSPKLSAVSWFFIELFALGAVFFLPFSKSAAEITLVVALALWILRKWPWDERFPSIKPFNTAYLLFLAFTLLSLIHVPQEHWTLVLRGFWKWLRWIAAFFMFYELALNPKRIHRFLGVFLLMIGLVCLNGAYQLFAGMDLVKNYSIHIPGRFMRLKSSLGSPNSLACFLSMSLPLTFYLWLKQKTWSLKSGGILALLILIAVALLTTLSRGAVLGLLVAAFLYLAFRGNIKTLLLVVFSTALLFFSSKLFFSNFVSSLNFKDITIGERFRFWQISWDMIRAHPLVGNGVNMYYQKFSEFAPASESYRGYAHNCYLQMWSEIGIFGLIAFLWPLVFVLGKNMFIKKTMDYNLNNAIGLSLVAYLTQAFFDTNFYSFQVATLFWIFWGVYVALENKTEVGYN